jgi:hypothetical protein
VGRRAVLFLIIAAGLALLGPAPAAAGEGFEYKVVYNFCDGADPKFKVRNIADGFTNANKLTNETWIESKPGGAGQQWSKIYTFDLARYKFRINGDKHWLTSWRTWDGDRFHWYRIGFRIRAWHNTTLLSSTTLYSKKC